MSPNPTGDRRAPVKTSAVDVVRGAYSVSSFGLWAVAVGAILRLGGPALETAGRLTDAITRASVALEHVAADTSASREAMTRLELSAARSEAHSARVESELAAMRTTLAEIRGSVAGRR